MPSTRDVDQSVQPVPGSERESGESRLAGVSGPAGILDRVPDDLRRVLPDEVIDELLAGRRTEEEIAGPGGLLSQSSPADPRP